MKQKYNNPSAANNHNNLPDNNSASKEGGPDKTEHATKGIKHIRARKDYEDVGEGDAQLPKGGKED
jgi:hypothetical protein